MATLGDLLGHLLGVVPHSIEGRSVLFKRRSTVTGPGLIAVCVVLLSHARLHSLCALLCSLLNIALKPSMDLRTTIIFIALHRGEVITIVWPHGEGCDLELEPALALTSRPQEFHARRIVIWCR